MGVEAMMTGPTDRVLDEGEKPLTAPVAHHGRVGNPPRQCARGRQSRPSRSRGSNGYPNRCFPGTGVQSGTRESGTGATLEDMNQSCRQGRSGARGFRGERTRRRQAQELMSYAWPSRSWSGCRDSNPGPLDPQSSALTKLRHSPYLVRGTFCE